MNNTIAHIMVHSGKILFSPLPQLHMVNVLIDNKIRSLDEMTILEYENSTDLHRIFMDIIDHNPSVVCFSCYLWNFKIVEQISYSLKQYYGDKIVVIWGGPHLSEEPILFVKKYYESFDFLVGWYGERPILEIIKRLDETNKNIQEVKDSLLKDRVRGIYFRNPGKGLLVEMSSDEDERQKLVQIQKREHSLNGAKHFNSYNQLSGDFYGIRAGEFPPFNSLSFAHRYPHLPETMTKNKKERVVLLETYRGCSYSCKFCLWGEADKKLDYFPAPRMIEELNTLMSYGYTEFSFADAGFGLKRQRDLEFLRYVDSLPASSNIRISSYFFWQTLDDEMLDMVEALVKKKIIGQLDLSIQTFQKPVTEIMARPTNYNRFHETITRVQKRNIPFQMDLILFLPGDNLDGYLESVRKTMAYKPDKFQTFPLYILPGSGYDKQREELGIKTLRGSRTHDTEVVIETASFPIEEGKKALWVESFFYFTYTLRLLNKPFYHLAEKAGKDFYDVVMTLKDWATEHSPTLTKTVDRYYSNIYEDRHHGRKELDIYLLNNFDQAHEDLKKFIEFFLKENGKEDCLTECLEYLAYSMLVFPKRFSTTSSLKSFPLVSISENDRRVVAEFSSKSMLDESERDLVGNKEKFQISFTERDTNFREGGISTQYHHWKYISSVS